jgi:hypothetical protein
MLNLDWDKCLSRYEQRKVLLSVKAADNYVLKYFYLIDSKRKIYILEEEIVCYA